MSNVQLSSPSTPAGKQTERQPAPARPLTDEQYTTFWTWYKTSLKAGRKFARKYVEKGDGWDVVDDAVVAMLDEMTREIAPRPFPKTEGQFCGRFFTKVRDRAVDYRRGCAPAEHPVRTRWGKAERRLPARFSPDRPLWKIFDSLDAEAIAVANEEPEPCAFVVHHELPLGLRRYPHLNWNAFNLELVTFLNNCVYARLPIGQGKVIGETYFTVSDEPKTPRSRKEIAKKLGISVKTYDEHHRRAIEKLRPMVAGWSRSFDPYDENPWPGIIEAMSLSWKARQAADGDGGQSETDARRAA